MYIVETYKQWLHKGAFYTRSVFHKLTEAQLSEWLHETAPELADDIWSDLRDFGHSTLLEGRVITQTV